MATALLMYWGLCCIMNLSVMGIRDTEICELNDLKPACRHLSHQDLKEIRLLENNCITNNCQGCQKRWATLIWTEGAELVPMDRLVVNTEEAESGKAELYKCTQHGFPCACSGLQPCTGNAQYCKALPCDKNSTCYCEPRPAHRRWYHVRDDGTAKENPKIVSFHICAYKRPEPVNRRKARTLLQDEESSEAVFQEHGMKLSYAESVVTASTAGTLIVRVGGHEKIYTLKADRLQVVLPGDLLISPAKMSFIFINTEGKTIAGTIHLPGSRVCRRIQCLMCVELLRNLDCLPKIIAYAIYTCAVLVSAVTFVYVRTVIGLCYATIHATYVTIRQLVRMIKGGARLSLATGANVGHRLRNTFQQVNNYLETQDAGRMNKQTLLLALLCVTATAQAICTNHELLSGDIEECTQVDGQQKCELSTHAHIVLENIGYTSCIWIHDDQRRNVLALTLRLDAIECHWQTTTIYFTFPVEMKMVSQLACPNNRACGWGTWCKSNYSFEALTRESMGYAGATKCFAADSGSAPCLVIDSQACLHYRYYFIPDYMRAYEVRRLSSYVCSYHLYVTETANGTQEALSVRSKIKTQSGIEVGVVGSYDQPTSFPNTCLITRVGDPTESYIEECSPPGRPRATEVGDIQANHSLAKYFLFDEQSVSCSAYEEKMHCDRRESYLLQLIQKKGNRLPRAIGFHLMKTTGEGALRSNLLHSAPVTASLKFSKYTFSVEKTTVCPAFGKTDYRVEGCYRCGPLAKLMFEAYSSCEPGMVQVHLESITVITQAVKLETTIRELALEFRSEHQCVSDTLCLAADTTKRCMKVQFCLEDPQLDLRPANSSYLMDVVRGATLQSSFLSWIPMWGSFTATGLVKTLAISAISVFLLIFSAATLVTCCRTRA